VHDPRIADAPVYRNGPEQLRRIFCGDLIFHDPKSEHWQGDFARGAWSEYLYDPAAHDVCLRAHLHPSIEIRQTDWQPPTDGKTPLERLKERLDHLTE
jgi:hypothetical protein